MPSVLPCTVVFFSVQHFVDRHNLVNDVYRQGPDSENLFVTRALHYMRCIVAGWWVVMGSSFGLVLRHGLADAWDCRVPACVVEGALFSLVGGGVCIIVWSWWDQESILHDAHFQMVDVADRGRHRKIVFSLLGSASGASGSASLAHGADQALGGVCVEALGYLCFGTQVTGNGRPPGPLPNP